MYEVLYRNNGKIPLRYSLKYSVHQTNCPIEIQFLGIAIIDYINEHTFFIPVIIVSNYMNWAEHKFICRYILNKLTNNAFYILEYIVCSLRHHCLALQSWRLFQM